MVSQDKKSMKIAIEMTLIPIISILRILAYWGSLSEIL